MKKINIEKYKKDGQIDYEKLLNKTFVVETTASDLKKFGFEIAEEHIVNEYTLLDYHLLEPDEIFLKVKDLNKDNRWISIRNLGTILFVYEKEEKSEYAKENDPLNDWQKWKKIMEEQSPKTNPIPKKPWPYPPYYPDYTQPPWTPPRPPGYWPDYITICKEYGENFNSGENNITS